MFFVMENRGEKRMTWINTHNRILPWSTSYLLVLATEAIQAPNLRHYIRTQLTYSADRNSH